MTSVRDILDTMDYGPAPESNSHVVSWLNAHASGFGHFIGGNFVDTRGGAHFDVMNPANGERLGRVAEGTAADVDAAVKAARKAFGPWSNLAGHQRAKHIYAIARLIQKRERFLSVLESMDNGKPIRESRDIDVPLTARHFYHHAGWAELVEDEFPGFRPVGVCGQIIPWNFPLLMLAWKIAPAIAAGNTVVLKPAEYTPLTALAFAEICRESGLPGGVVNIVTGDGKTGALLVEHEGVDKIAFTGSTDVGRIIRRSTAGTGKKLSLELGGKSPFIVHEDADLDAAVEGVVDAIWFNQGQVCCAGTRLLIQEGIAARFLAKLKRRMDTLRVGDPLDKSVDMGAIVDPIQLRRIREIVAQGEAEGGTLIQSSCDLPTTGNYFPPSLFVDVEPSSTVMDVEIFGPVAAAMTFRTPDEAVQIANHTRYGLAATIWSENINLALDTAARMKAGVVWINSTNLFDAAAGFGGYRESGFGREGGREGIYEYLVAGWERDIPQNKEKISEPLRTTPAEGANVSLLPSIDRTAKLYIGGTQARPDSGYSYTVFGPKNSSLGQAGLGNRKDVRNAVEEAGKANGWSSASAHNRAQVLYYIGENLSARAEEFSNRLHSAGQSTKSARIEVETTISRIFYYAAQADKFDGRVHATKSRHVTLAMNEPFGVMGLLCPEEMPLLGFVSLVMPAIAMGNRVVVVPSARQPFSATDFYQVLDTSDVPGGVVNIVTGDRDELGRTLAEHDDVAALWYFGSLGGTQMVEQASAGNLKSTWCNNGKVRNWLDNKQGQGLEFLRHATQVKNIWVPYGE